MKLSLYYLFNHKNMDKLQKILLILIVALLSISSPINTFAEEDDIDMSFLAELLNDPALEEGVAEDEYIEEEVSEEEELDLTSADDTYTSEAMFQAQNWDNIIVENVASNNTIATTTENVAVSVLPTTWAEHILLLLLSFVMAGAIYYKKKIIK